MMAPKTGGRDSWDGGGGCSSSIPHRAKCDPSMALALELAANRSGIVVDIGANGGRQMHTARGFDRKVIGIECLGSAYLDLQRLFAADQEVRVYHLCAGATLGMTKLYLAADSSSQVEANVQNGHEAKKRQKEMKAGHGSVEHVLTAPLGEILKGEEAIAVLKVDVQGAEYDAFEGMRERIGRDLPVIMYEQDTSFIYAKSVFKDFLQELGYKCVERKQPIGLDYICSVAV